MTAKYAETYEEYRVMVEKKIAIKDPIAQIPAAHGYKYRYPSGRLVSRSRCDRKRHRPRLSCVDASGGRVR